MNRRQFRHRLRAQQLTTLIERLPPQVLPLPHRHVESVESNGIGIRREILQRPDSSIATISPSIIVSSGSLARAAAVGRKRLLNRFLLRENRAPCPSCFTANARYPSSFNSYCQASPSGNFFTARHGMGSMKCASLIVVSIFALPLKAVRYVLAPIGSSLAPFIWTSARFDTIWRHGQEDPQGG